MEGATAVPMEIKKGIAIWVVEELLPRAATENLSSTNYLGSH